MIAGVVLGVQQLELARVRQRVAELEIRVIDNERRLDGLSGVVASYAIRLDRVKSEVDAQDWVLGIINGRLRVIERKYPTGTGR